MLRGFYTAASEMIAQQRHQETLSNNIANANTPGYKADQDTLRAFPELLMQQMGGSSPRTPMMGSFHTTMRQPIGSLHTGVYVQETIPNNEQGDLKETRITTDVALVNGVLPDEAGNVFFTVQNEAGEVRYTRNGNFTVDGEGALVTNQGYYVLDQDGNPIQTNGMEFLVSREGLLQVDGQNIPIGVAYTENANEMEKEGNGLYNGEAGAVPADATFTVHQGMLEQSNVDSLQAMTQMMDAYRMFETNQ